MAIEHAAGAAHKHNGPTLAGHASAQSADHDGCPPSRSGGALCCGHSICSSGWNLAVAPDTLAELPITRVATDSTTAGLIAVPSFPALEPPKT